MQVKDNAYQEHEIFAKLDEYISFYDYLPDAVMSFMTRGTKAVGNIDTYVLMSFSGTLDSLRAIIRLGHLNDAYALLRKLYDGIYINIYTCLYLEDNVSLEQFIVTQIQDWLSGKVQLPNTRTISDYIRTHKSLAELNELLFNDKRYAEMRDRCNDNTHYNYYWNVLLNDPNIYNKERKKVMNDLSNDLSELVLMHLSWLFYLNDHYMMSSDYIDYMDMNMTPPEDSQYWVSPLVQDIFNSLIKKLRPDIAELIKSKSSMHLE